MDQEWNETHTAPHLDGIYLSVVSARRAVLVHLGEGQRTVVAPRRGAASCDLSSLCMPCPVQYHFESALIIQINSCNKQLTTS